MRVIGKGEKINIENPSSTPYTNYITKIRAIQSELRAETQNTIQWGSEEEEKVKEIEAQGV